MESDFLMAESGASSSPRPKRLLLIHDSTTSAAATVGYSRKLSFRGAVSSSGHKTWSLRRPDGTPIN
ncbi:MAG: hypothetical protein FJW36_23890 [Acidobacteria bacterium]|nr:hypothetical protein [Acidobacteriota bacterium]